MFPLIHPVIANPGNSSNRYYSLFSLNPPRILSRFLPSLPPSLSISLPPSLSPSLPPSHPPSFPHITCQANLKTPNDRHVYFYAMSYSAVNYTSLEYSNIVRYLLPPTSLLSLIYFASLSSSLSLSFVF